MHQKLHPLPGNRMVRMSDRRKAHRHKRRQWRRLQKSPIGWLKLLQKSQRRLPHSPANPSHNNIARRIKTILGLPHRNQSRQCITDHRQIQPSEKPSRKNRQLKRQRSNMTPSTRPKAIRQCTHRQNRHRKRAVLAVRMIDCFNNRLRVQRTDFGPNPPLGLIESHFVFSESPAAIKRRPAQQRRTQIARVGTIGIPPAPIRILCPGQPLQSLFNRIAELVRIHLKQRKHRHRRRQRAGRKPPFPEAECVPLCQQRSHMVLIRTGQLLFQNIIHRDFLKPEFHRKYIRYRQPGQMHEPESRRRRSGSRLQIAVPLHESVPHQHPPAAANVKPLTC